MGRPKRETLKAGSGVPGPPSFASKTDGPAGPAVAKGGQ